MQRSRFAIVLEVITTAAIQTPAPRWADKNSNYRVALGEHLGVDRFHAAALSSFSAPRATILIALSGKGRCSALASSHGAHPLARESLPSPNILV